MFGKRHMQEYSIIDDPDTEVIVVLGLDTPTPDFIGAYTANKYTHKPITMLNKRWLQEMLDSDLIRCTKVYDCYDLCLN